MTTIRKIPTSKIDGDDSNNTSTNEIRPFGELAVYIDNDNNGGADKLELLMFDGVRTHLRSKVLAKGTFYGGDADSADQGDGIENFDTIKLIPDAELHYNDSEYGNDQYIVIDPTFPNHIHVRAGGAIDNSNALLILGGEENHVTVSDGDDQVTIYTNDDNTWTFGDNGTTTFPDGSEQTTAWTGTVSTPAIGAAKNVIVIQSASSILNTRFASLPPAPISNYAVPGTGIVVNVAWSTNGEDYHSPGFTVVNGGSGHTGGGEFGGGTVLTVPYADMGISGGGNWTWYVVDVASDIVLTTGLSTWRFGGDGNLSLPNPDANVRSQIRSSNDGMQTIFETFQGGQVTKLTLDYDDSEVKIQSFPGIEWTFGETGTLNLPNNSPKISSGNGLQIGSTTTIATDSSEGTGSGTPGVVDVPFNGTLSNTYPAGSTITFNNGDVRTITSISQVGSGGTAYLDINYSGTATASSPEFPITLKTANFVASYTAPEWTFGTDGVLTIPDGGIVGGPVGTNKIDLSWDVSVISGKTIKINPGAGGVVSPTYWSFSSSADGGAISLPLGSVLDNQILGVLIAGAGETVVNQFYTKVSETEYRYYPTPNDPNYHRLILQGGTWALDVLGLDNPRYTSVDLLTWTGGETPAPTGTLRQATNLTVGTEKWTFDQVGTLTLPGAVVNSTVAKTGVANPGINKVATVSIEPTFDATWANATIVSVPGFSCDINFQGNGNAVFFNIVDTVGNRTVGDVLATVLGSTLGITGVDGDNDMVIKVATLTDTIATALDLTKSVNKLVNGSYTLADGVEGQIMYLVLRNGSLPANVNVSVANSRIIGVNVIDSTLLPFRVYNDSDDSYYDSTGLCTLIFTDGAWQQQGGAWDFT
jgi:hypothetical protein